MAVFQKAGAWWIEYYFEGRRKRERIGKPLTKEMKKVATDTLAKRRVEIAENKFLDKKVAPRCTFSELAELYIGWAETHHRGIASTRCRVNQLLDAFGNVQLAKITPLEVDAYIQSRAEIRKPATVNREVEVLRHMFRKGMEWQKADHDPVEHVRPLRINNKRLRFLSTEEIDRLLGIADRALYPILTVALHTGMRRGELFKLKWKDLNFETGFLNVADPKNGEPRQIPMNDLLVQTLRRIPRRLDTPYVFPGKNGNGLVDIRKRFNRALQAAGIEDFKFHDLRHTFASHLVMSGVDLATVKELLGHKSIEMTLRYSHLAPDHKKAAVARLVDTYMDTRQEKKATASAATY